MLLTVVALVFGARSVLFLLERIDTARVVRVLRPPSLIAFRLLLAATFGATTGLLPLFEPRMGMKPATTERTPPPREHSFPSRELPKEKQNRTRKEIEKAKGESS
jgi:hypothetical protein